MGHPPRRGLLRVHSQRVGATFLRPLPLQGSSGRGCFLDALGKGMGGPSREGGRPQATSMAPPAQVQDRRDSQTSATVPRARNSARAVRPVRNMVATGGTRRQGISQGRFGVEAPAVQEKAGAATRGRPPTAAVPEPFGGGSAGFCRLRRVLTGTRKQVGGHPGGRRGICSVIPTDTRSRFEPGIVRRSMGGATCEPGVLRGHISDQVAERALSLRARVSTEWPAQSITGPEGPSGGCGRQCEIMRGTRRSHGPERTDVRWHMKAHKA